MSLRDQILQAKDLPEELVDVPEWGVTVLVRGMSAATRSEFMKRASEKGQEAVQGDVIGFQTDLILATAYDPESSEALFGDEDRELLGQKAGSAVDKLFLAASRLSGFTPTAVEEAGKD